MYYVFILFVSVIICDVNSFSFEQNIQWYFNSESIQKFRKEWDLHRKPLENAILIALKETVGYTGMNVYVRKVKDKLAMGYYHDDNQVKLILKNLNLEGLPRCWLPEVQFSLSSNVVKIQTVLSKMIIHADYALIRNKSDIIYDMKHQNPYQSSPFLFEQVHEYGKVAITMNGCILLGFVMTKLSGESVNLGYQQFRLVKCQYTFEIYKPGSGSPPVIAKYVPYRENNGLSIAHLLMRQINDELTPKLQAAMFSFVNTSAVFGNELLKFKVHQEQAFRSTSVYITELVRNINKITVQKNKGVAELEDFMLFWDDEKPRPKSPAMNGSIVGEKLKLTEMVLTGLDTLYSAHIGGPYKLNTIMVGEEIRFSTLQVRGFLELESTWVTKYAFAAEINDLAVDLQLIINSDVDDQRKSNKKMLRSKQDVILKNVAVTGYRTMSFTVPNIIYGSAEALISGLLLNEVPKVIQKHLKATIPEALEPSQKLKKNNLTEDKKDYDKEEVGTDNDDSYSFDESDQFLSTDETLSNSEDKDKMRNVFNKGKKRFKSYQNSKKKYRRKERVSKNIIL